MRILSPFGISRLGALPWGGVFSWLSRAGVKPAGTQTATCGVPISAL